MRRDLRWKLALQGLGALGLLGAACTGMPESDPDRGQVAFGLNLAGNAVVTSVHYVLSGPRDLRISGDIDVRTSNRATLFVGGLPVAPGYRIALSATSTNGLVQCKGGQAFDAVSGVTTNVEVELLCDAADASAAVFDVCPTVIGSSASSSSAPVGSAIRFAANVNPGRGLTITYKWSLDNRDLATLTPASAFDAGAPGTGDGSVHDGGGADGGTSDGGEARDAASVEAGAPGSPTASGNYQRANLMCNAEGSGTAKLTTFAGSCPMLTTEFPFRCTAKSADGGVKLNVCPNIAFYSFGLDFFRLPVGKPLPLTVSASDADGDPLAYAWKTSTPAVGDVTGSDTAAATFTCTSVGTTEVSLFVSDGQCVTTRDPALPITCVAN